MTLAARGARWSFVPAALGLFLVAAGAADGHDLVVSQEADWPLVMRADLALLAGFWLLSGRWLYGSRVAVIAAYVIILAYDLNSTVAGYPSRYPFGHVVVRHGWVILGDLVVVVSVLIWRTAPGQAARVGFLSGHIARATLIAAALGVVLDRSTVGQFPIIAKARAGRSSAGLDYLVYLPDGYYRTWNRWPLILTLHGRGESGEDIGLVRRQGLPRYVEEKGGLPFLIVAPQSSDWIWNVEALSSLLDEVIRRYRVDVDRVYLVGNSMGGTGTWALAARYPERFAAIAPICGVGDPTSAGRLSGVPTWAFHGVVDRVVSLEKSERMIAVLKKAGGDARLTAYPDVGHDAWTLTFANPRFYEWLLQHRLTNGGQSRFLSRVRIRACAELYLIL
jgi:dienelactone hydrolase